MGGWKDLSTVNTGKAPQFLLNSPTRILNTFLFLNKHHNMIGDDYTPLRETIHAANKLEKITLSTTLNNFEYLTSGFQFKERLLRTVKLQGMTGKS